MCLAPRCWCHKFIEYALCNFLLNGLTIVSWFGVGENVSTMLSSVTKSIELLESSSVVQWATSFKSFDIKLNGTNNI